MTERAGQATVYEIASRAGVSIATVSRVVNGAAGIRPATRDRVLTAIEELAYVPNGSAQGMARRSTGVLGLVYRRRMLPRADDTGRQASGPRARLVDRTQHSLVFYDEIIRGVEEAAMQAGRMLLLRGAPGDADIAALLAMTGKCDGLVLMDRVMPDAEIARIIRQVPVASIANIIDAPGVTNVTVDNRAAMIALIDHMIDQHGARRIAFLGGPADNGDARERAAAVVARAGERGAQLEPLDAWRGDYTPTSAFDIVSRRCATKAALPDVILCANDGSAMGAIAALAALGLKVPADIAVTGFDDMELAALTTPALTTIRQPLEQMAHIAVDALAGAEGGRPRLPANHVVPADLIVRRSCGCGARHARPRAERGSQRSANTYAGSNAR